MFGRTVAVAALIALAGCAGWEPAGRNAQRSPAPAARPAPVQTATPAPARVTPTPPPVQTATPTPPPQAPVQTATQAPPRAAPTPPPVQTATPAPRLALPPAAQTATTTPAPTVRQTPPPAPVLTPPSTQVASSSVDDNDIVVPGQREVQVAPPQGDPRSMSQRMEDVRAWDQCVTQVQSAFERDPMRPQLTTPEEYCRQSLGMVDRTSMPESRRVPRR